MYFESTERLQDGYLRELYDTAAGGPGEESPCCGYPAFRSPFIPFRKSVDLVMLGLTIVFRLRTRPILKGHRASVANYTSSSTRSVLSVTKVVADIDSAVVAREWTSYPPKRLKRRHQHAIHVIASSLALTPFFTRPAAHEKGL